MVCLLQITMTGYILWIVIIPFTYHTSVYSTTSILEPFTMHQSTGIRLLHQYIVQQLDSILHCIIECSLDTRCLAVNYQWTSRMCELNNISSYAVNGFNSENADNWTIYNKGIPSCNTDWLTHDQSCYYFSTEATSWHDAVAACQNKSAILVQIESEDENYFLVEGLTILHGESWNNGYWTNGNDFDVENQWVWGYPVGQAIGPFRNWGMGEPNGYETESCLAFLGPFVKWVDVICSFSLRYICERKPSI